MFLLTIKGLDATPVVVWQPVSVRVDVLISGEHECSSVPGVIQAQSVAELMGRHQQQIHTSTQQFHSSASRFSSFIMQRFTAVSPSHRY